MVYLFCPICNNKLGERVGGKLIIRHGNRVIVALAVLTIRCEDCGEVWRPEVQGGTIPPAQIVPA